MANAFRESLFFGEKCINGFVKFFKHSCQAGLAMQVEKVKKAVDIAKQTRSDLFLEGKLALLAAALSTNVSCCN